MSKCMLTSLTIAVICICGTRAALELELVSVFGNGVVRSSPINQADRNWDEETPIPVKIIRKGTESRIVGGHTGKIEDIPYYVLISKGEHAQWCGGAIFNKYTIITAAHCLYSAGRRFDISILTVTAGQSNLNDATGSEITRKVGNAEIHPNYNSSEFYYDVALLLLSEALVFSKSVEPLTIATSSVSHKGIMMVAGFGYVKQKRGIDETIPANFADKLKYAHATIIQKPECLQKYQRIFELTVPIIQHQTLMCAIGEERKGGVTDDACQGDSGGPGVCTDELDEGYLCGIIATGIGCGLKGYPGIYTNVSVVSDWIKENAAQEVQKSSASTLESFLARSWHLRLMQRNKASRTGADNDTSSEQKKKHPTSSTMIFLLQFLLVLSEFLFGLCL